MQAEVEYLQKQTDETEPADETEGSDAGDETGDDPAEGGDEPTDGGGEPVEKLTEAQSQFLEKIGNLEDSQVESLIKYVDLFVSGSDADDLVTQLKALLGMDIAKRLEKIEKSSDQVAEPVHKTVETQKSGKFKKI